MTPGWQIEQVTLSTGYVRYYPMYYKVGWFSGIPEWKYMTAKWTTLNLSCKQGVGSIDEKGQLYFGTLGMCQAYIEEKNIHVISRVIIKD